jgi:EAL domain-containing protein (putative c-di-GMP-specific phosphodiesterase class I)
MYLAKSRGRGQYAVFEPSMHAAAMTRLELQRDLSHALERGEFSIVYQPVHALESGALAGAEAFLRWIHPVRGPIPPGTFVPLAEEAGLMLPIGRWVLARACRDAQAWRKLRRGRGLRVSVNLSSRQIPEESLFEDVEEAVRVSGLEPGALVLELTEPMLVQHPDSALKLLRKLKTLGVRIAIDDFGTGYSSLSHLQRLPIDILKIDRTFVDTVTKDEHAAQFTRTIVSLSESMSLVTIAEGIETAAQAERLRALGCDFGQGYHFGMPMSAEALGNYADRSRMLVG